MAIQVQSVGRGKKYAIRKKAQYLMLILILHPTLPIKYTDAMNRIGKSKQNLTLGYNVEVT